MTRFYCAGMRAMAHSQRQLQQRALSSSSFSRSLITVVTPSMSRMTPASLAHCMASIHTSLLAQQAGAVNASSTAGGAAPPTRPRVTSAQLRAQRPRTASNALVASTAAAGGDMALCGPTVEAEGDDEDKRSPVVTAFNPLTGERNGPRGLEPTRYGDWEAKGRCWDF